MDTEMLRINLMLAVLQITKRKKNQNTMKNKQIRQRAMLAVLDRLENLIPKNQMHPLRPPLALRVILMMKEETRPKIMVNKTGRQNRPKCHERTRQHHLVDKEIMTLLLPSSR